MLMIHAVGCHALLVDHPVGAQNMCERVPRLAPTKEPMSAPSGLLSREGEVINMAPVIEVTRSQLQARRKKILTRLGITWDEYLRRARESELSGEEWDVRDDLDSIAFLLGEHEFID